MKKEANQVKSKGSFFLLYTTNAISEIENDNKISNKIKNKSLGNVPCEVCDANNVMFLV